MSVRQLEDAGFVTRRPSPTDGRATIVELTERGRALLPRLKRAWREVGERTVAGLSTTDPNTLTDVLAELASSLDAGGSMGPDVPRYIARSRTP